MKIRTVVLTLILIVLPVLELNAAPVNFTREYTYHAGEADSLITSRTIATEEIKRALLEELGTFLISRTEVKNAKLTKDEIVSLTAGSVALIIIDHRWNGSEYWMKAEIKADPDQVTKAVLALKNNEEQAEELKSLRDQADKDMKEIERLKKQIAELKKSEGENSAKVTQARKEYEDVVTGLSAKETTEKAYILFRENKNQEAVEVLNQAIAANPTNASLYVTRGVAYDRLKKYDQMLNNYNEVIKAIPNNSQLYYQRIFAYSRMKQYDKALEECERCIRMRPDYLPFYTAPASIYYQQRDYRNALNAYNRALAVFPNDTSLYHGRAGIYVAMKQYDKAIEDETRVIEANPRHFNAFRVRGQSYRMMKKYDLAIADFESAVKLQPKGYTGTQNELASLYHVLKRYDDAVNAYTQSININPSVGFVYYQRSLDYEALGKKDEARQDLKKAASLGYKPAEKKLGTGMAASSEQKGEETDVVADAILHVMKDIKNAFTPRD